ncbi:MAG: hypothetical protein HN580_27285 [Deltaproteobacteria bacterium]|jgi:glycerol kinase|nr:hypothetical protein [Deltaproteobacteria bacterium]MBT4268869.1 hypothetical protein [Deltaproteobacteria bacterium]MBT4641843.1 hypothetical protein [Deltaproteobacteria bacterium]MBT6504584.1 hypothetical protein [Deltaproteobacteria bacterium]MBT6611253.1 hypothetical protein [Deltaproteobacteria bacterium]
MGAAFLAGLATGVWDSPEQIQKMWHKDRRFEPAREQKEIESLLQGWHDAIKRTRSEK